MYTGILCIRNRIGIQFPIIGMINTIGYLLIPHRTIKSFCLCIALRVAFFDEHISNIENKTDFLKDL